MPPSSTIQIQGIDIHQRIQGHGAPLLMLHGWGANIELLQPLANRLSSTGYRCYLFDLPGFGESAEPPAPFSIFDYADFAIAYMDHHGLERTHIFGHSLGGRIGLILGAKHAERVSKMALSNCAGVKTQASLTARARLKVHKGIRGGLDAVGAGALSDKLRQLYNRRYASADYLAASPVMRQTLVKVVNQDLLGLAGSVDAPTILIWGDQDQDTPLWMGKALEEAMADAALITHQGAGHYAYLDYPDETAAIMRALFDGD